MATATKTTSELVVTRLEVENFMRLESLTVDLKGRHLRLSGVNGVGKSSGALAIWAALYGVSSREVPEPIHEGSSRATIAVDIADASGRPAFKLERTWDADKGMKLNLRSADGKRFTRAQELLDGFLDAVALDPASWIRKRPRDQVDDVLKFFGITPPVSAVEEITGENHEPKEGESASEYLERLSADEVGLYYDRRRQANRLWTQKQGALEDARTEAVGLGDEKPARSIHDLLQRLESLSAQRNQRADLLAAARKAESDHSAAKAKLGGLETEHATVGNRIQALRDELAALEAKHAELDGRIAKGRGVVSDLGAEAIAAGAKAGAVPDPTQDIAAINDQIAAAEKDSQEAAKRRAALENLDRLELETKAAQETHAALSLQLDQLRDLRRNLLNGVDLGVDGLEIGQGELRMNGKPFTQASMAQRLIVACAIVFQRSPKLKILRLDDAEHLDEESEKHLLRLAEQHGWRCVLSMVVRGQKDLKVEII